MDKRSFAQHYRLLHDPLIQSEAVTCEPFLFYRHQRLPAFPIGSVWQAFVFDQF